MTPNKLLLLWLTSLLICGIAGCKSYSQYSTVQTSNDLPPEWWGVTVDASKQYFKPYIPGIYSTAHIVTHRSSCTGVVIRRSHNKATILTHLACGVKNYRSAHHNHATDMEFYAKCSDKIVAYFNTVQGIEKHLVEARCVDGSMVSGEPYKIIAFDVQGKIPDHIRALSIAKKPLTEKRAAYLVHHSRATTYTNTLDPIALSAEQKERFLYKPSYARLSFKHCYVIGKEDQTGLRAFLTEKFSPGWFEDRKEKQVLDKLTADIISGIRNNITGGYEGLHLHTCPDMNIAGDPLIDAETHELLGLALAGKDQIMINDFKYNDGTIGLSIKNEFGGWAGSFFFMQRAATAHTIREVFALPY